MGIFDFLKKNKKREEENSKLSEPSVSQTTNENEISKVSTSNLKEKEIILSEDEIQEFIKREIKERTSSDANFELSSFLYDPKFKEAAEVIVVAQQGSASLIQRKLKLGYNRAGKLVDQLESAGIVGAFNGSKARDVLISDLSSLDTLLKVNDKNNDRFNHFKEHVLPIHEALIFSKVNEVQKAQEIEEKNKLKEILKKEILDKENEKIEKEKIRQLKIQARNELIEKGLISDLDQSATNRRESIAQDVLDKVWNRDGGKCVLCGTQEKLEFDHIIPYSKGGSNTYRNLQILCETCNLQKSNKIG